MSITAEAARIILEVRQRVRADEIRRMRQFAAEYNIASSPQMREQTVKLYDYLKHPPTLFTWDELCKIVPEAETILSHCILQPELVTRLQQQFGDLPQPWRALKPEKQVALVMMVAGFNVFVTGSAGVGKSQMVISARNTIQAVLATAMSDMIVTGSTGTAACNVGGRTLASALMLMCGDEARVSGVLRKRLKYIQCLLVDEISMVGVRDLYRSHLRMSDAMRLIERQELREGELPFGGVQILAVGDFCQLSDVRPARAGFDKDRRMNEDRMRDMVDFRRVPGELAMFDRWRRAFATPLWRQTFGHVALMQKIERQNDMPFINFLQQIRMARINQSDAVRFVHTHSCSEADVPDSAMFLYSTNDEADVRNATKMMPLPGPDIVFSMLQLGRLNEDGEREKRSGELAKHRSESTLRVGARARIWSNYSVELGITNGTQCKLVGLVPITSIGVSYTLASGGESTVTQPFPDPEFATTMKEMYGAALFDRRQHAGGVVLLPGSGFRMSWDEDGIRLLMTPGDYSVYHREERHPLNYGPEASTVRTYHRAEGAARGSHYNYQERQDNATRWFCAAVQFFHAGIDSRDVYILSPTMITTTEQNGGVESPIFTQVQMPLMPGYASTVHSAMGLTLDSVAISLSRIMDPALPYVALSRAIAASSIFLIGDLSLHNCRPDHLVVTYYSLLEALARRA